jgi:tetratricopeptide (TPR) repeat protein
MMARHKFCSVGVLRGIGGSLVILLLTAASVAAQQASPEVRDRAEARQLLARAIRIVPSVDNDVDKAYLLEEIGIAQAKLGNYDQSRADAAAAGTDKARENIFEEVAVRQAVAGHPADSAKTIGFIASPARKIDAFIAVADALLQFKRKPEAILALEHAAEVKLPPDTDDEEEQEEAILIGWSFVRAGAPDRATAMAAILHENSLTEEAKATLAAIVTAYAHDLEKARITLTPIETDSFKRKGLHAIAEAALEANNKPVAATVYKQIIQLAQKLEKVPTEEIRNVAEAQYKGDPTGARETVRFWLDAMLKDADDETIGNIAGTQAFIGDIEGALKTLERIQELNDQIVGREYIAFARAREGEVARALATPVHDDAYSRAIILVQTTLGILERLHRAAAAAAAPAPTPPQAPGLPNTAKAPVK